MKPRRLPRLGVFYLVDVPPARPPDHARRCSCLRCHPVVVRARTAEHAAQQVLPMLGGPDPAHPMPTLPEPAARAVAPTVAELLRAQKPLPELKRWQDTAAPAPPGGFRAWKKEQPK